MEQIPPIEDAYIDSIIKSGGAYQPSLTKTQGVKLRELMKLFRDRFEQEMTALPAIIGVKAQNFRLSRVYITDNFGGEVNSVSISSGELIHFEYSNADEQNVWQLQPLVQGGLVPELLYYVYCRCSRTDQSATYIVTTEEIKPEDEPGFYMFLAGVLYPVLDGYRDSDFSNGVADITGGRIKIGKIMSRDGQTGFDLDNGTIFGRITFRNNTGDLKDISEVETTAGNAQATANNAQASADTAITNAAEAKAIANNAKSQADAVMQELDDISNDSILDVSEKTTLIQRITVINSEYLSVIEQANKYNISTEAYTSFKNYINYYAEYGWFIRNGENTAIDRANFDYIFDNYYNERQKIYTGVTNAAKVIVDNISVGGRNYIRNSNFYKGITGWGGNYGNETLSIVDGKLRVTANNTGNAGVYHGISIPPGEVTFSAKVTNFGMNNLVLYNEIGNHVDVVPGEISTFTFKYGATTTLFFILASGNAGAYFEIEWTKAEKGTLATDWTAAPEDLQSDLDAANQNAINSKNESIAASKAYADAQDMLTRTETAAYADGIVDAEEARAIADAQAKLNEAKADSTAKANMAEAEAKALAKLLVDNINVGGRNYFKRNTVIQPGLGSNNIVRTERGFNVTGVDANVGLVRLIDVIKSNGYWTISFDVSVNAVLWQGSKVEINDVNAMEFTAPLAPNKQHVVLTVNVQNWTAGVYNFVDLFDLSGQTYFFDNIKIEKGNKATDWTVAPEDLRSDLDAAKTQADQANQVISDLSNDNIVTPIEKNTLSQKYLDITNEYDVLVTQAATYSVDSSIYRSRFLDYLVPTLPGILTDMNSNSTVDGAYLDWIFAEYYLAKINLLKAITDIANGKINQNIDLINGKNYASGQMLYRDPEFAQGVNGIASYNNTGDGSVTVTRQYLEGAPNGSGFTLRINLSTTASPNLGGFYFATPSRANAIFIVRFYLAGLAGQTINFASNSYGDGGSFKWNTSNALVGGWQEIIGTITCGSTGSFSSTGFFHFAGNTNPVYLASATVYDMTAAEVDYLADATTKANAVQANLNNAITTLNKVVSKTDFLSTQIDGNVVATGTLIVGDAGGNNNAGITGVVDNASSSVRFWAGSSYAGRNLAPWRVLNNGKSYMTNVVISAGTTGRRAELDSSNNVFTFYDDANRSLMSLKDNITTFVDDDGPQTQRQLAGIIFNKYYNSNSTNPDMVNITGNGIYSNAATAAALNSNTPGAGTSVFASVIGYVRRAINYLAPGSFHAGIAGLANTPNSTGGYFKHMQGGPALTIDGKVHQPDPKTPSITRVGVTGTMAYSLGNGVYYMKFLNGIMYENGSGSGA